MQLKFNIQYQEYIGNVCLLLVVYRYTDTLSGKIQKRITDLGMCHYCKKRQVFKIGMG